MNARKSRDIGSIKKIYLIKSIYLNNISDNIQTIMVKMTILNEHKLDDFISSVTNSVAICGRKKIIF